MTDKAKKNFLWPEVSTVSEARSAVMYGVWAAAFSAIVTALAASWALGAGRTAFGIVNASAFVDAVIFAAVAFGIYKESRFAAVAGLIIFVGEKIFQVVETGNLPGVILVVVLIFCYIVSIRGTFALSKLRAKPAA